MKTLLIGNRASAIPDGAPAEGLWLPVTQLADSTGWELKPEGACLGDVCVPLPPGRDAEFVQGEWFNFGALAEHLSQPVAHDETAGAWCVGESAQSRQLALETLEAPNFSLPDYLGVQHQIQDYRGKKVFLVSWASW